MRYLDNTEKVTVYGAITGMVIFIILLLIFFPFILIWALNTLIPALAIEYSFINWFASLVIIFLFSSKNITTK